MEKKILEKFISKYNLGGACESVVYQATEEMPLYTRAISDDKNVLCEVQCSNLHLPIGEYAVYDTGRLKSLLNVLGDFLTVHINTVAERPTSLNFTDSSSEITFVLADQSVIPIVPQLKKLPPFEMEIVLDEAFTNRFIKSKNALHDVNTFTITSDGTTQFADIIIGFSTLNTNRIKLVAPTKEAVTISPISFSAKYFKEILLANKDAKTGTMCVSSKGLARVIFEADGISSLYYLVQEKANGGE
jgi:hypothetical protein